MSNRTLKIQESYIVQMIYDQNIAKLEGNDDEINDWESYSRECIFRVPAWLRSSKPEAFTPKFMGLGPYHHSRNNKVEKPKGTYGRASSAATIEEEKPHHQLPLLLTDTMKLLAAKRLQIFVPDNKDHVFENLVSEIGSVHLLSYYPPDVVSTASSNEQLVAFLTMDGFFLLALLLVLTNDPPYPEGYYSYILNGQHNSKPLLHPDGEELTRNVLVREVFMFENQIPNQILLRIWRFKPPMVGHCDEQLDSLMLTFCKDHCPISNFRDPSNTSTVVNDHDHLLALMYRLIVPKEEENVAIEKENEKKPQGSNNAEAGETTTPSSCLCLCNPFNKMPRRRSTSYCSPFRFLCIILMLPLALCLILVYTVRQLPKILREVLRSLYSFICSVLGFLEKYANPALGFIHEFLKLLQGLAVFAWLSTVTKAVAQVQEQTSGGLTTTTATESPESLGSNTVSPPPTIPNVVELDQVGILFKPALGRVYSIKFDERKCVFYLPAIKLDAKSEVIIRNLVAYETLTPKMNGPLIFTRYVELMRAIIDTAEDVKILVRSEIIHTKLSNEDVAKLFNGMTKTTRETRTEDLEQEIMKVNDSYKIKLEKKRFRERFMPGRMATALGVLIFLVLTALQTYCTAYQCSGVLTHRKAA